MKTALRLGAGALGAAAALWPLAQAQAAVRALPGESADLAGGRLADQCRGVAAGGLPGF